MSMTTQREEYLGNQSDRENSDSGAGIFKLARKTDPDTQAVLDARRKCLADEHLNRSARAFFCHLVDAALHPGYFDEKGEVTISDKAIAKTLNVTERTVYDWKCALVARGYIWISKKFVPNMWPRTTYHLSCLHPPPKEEKTDQDGTYGSGEKVRPAPSDALAAAGREKRNAALANKRAQQKLPLSGGLAVVTGSGGKSQNGHLQGISAVSRFKFRPSAEIYFGPLPQFLSAESRQEFRPTAETNFGSQPKPISAHSRNGFRGTAEADCGLKEPQKQIQSQDPLEKEKSNAVNRLSNRVKDGKKDGPRNLESEREFAAYCQELFRTAKTSDGKPEWEANSGLWIVCFRQNKRKAWAVMHELKTIKTERPHTIKKTLGATAMDLWQNNRVGA
jgi:hypothetical protein